MSEAEFSKEQDEDEEIDIGEEDLQLFLKLEDLSASRESANIKNINSKSDSSHPSKKSNILTNGTDTSDEDEDSPENVSRRIRAGCECTRSCFEDLDFEQVYRHRLNIAELTKIEHDMYLMGLTMASVANSKTTTRRTERQRQRANYVYKGKKVCLGAFLFLENVTLYHIKRIRNHVLAHGVTPRTHGNSGKKPHNAFSLDIYRNVEKYVKKYLKNYIKDFSKGQIVYGINRSDIYNSYKDHGRKPDEKLMGFSTFCHFMKEQFPQIKFQKTDPVGKHIPTTTENCLNISKKRNRLSKKIMKKSEKVTSNDTDDDNCDDHDEEEEEETVIKDGTNDANIVPVELLEGENVCFEDIVENECTPLSHFDLVPGEIYYLQPVENVEIIKN